MKPGVEFFFTQHKYHWHWWRIKFNVSCIRHRHSTYWCFQCTRSIFTTTSFPLRSFRIRWSWICFCKWTTTNVVIKFPMIRNDVCIVKFYEPRILFNTTPNLHQSLAQRELQRNFQSKPFSWIKIKNEILISLDVVRLFGFIKMTKWMWAQYASKSLILLFIQSFLLCVSAVMWARSHILDLQ